VCDHEKKGASARALRRAVALIAWLGGAIFLPAAVSNAQPGGLQSKTARVAPAAALRAAQSDVESMVARYGPAVVNIGTSAPSDQADQQAGGAGLDSLDPDDPVSALFRAKAAQPSAPSTVSEPPRVLWGAGSGFIISPDGIVATTAHVINRAEQVVVTLTDRRQFKADVLAVDPQSDVALLQIKGANKLPVLRLGDASHVRVGERVLAIGAPDGPQNAATSGFVSVTPHTLPDGTALTFLETDIAPDPDNSGGPLLDRSGAVIGVNIEVYAETGRYRSLTLAIPIDAVLRLRAQLQGQGKLAGGALGIQTQDVDPGLAAAFGLPRATGALVTAVAPAAHGAAASGLKAGDVITRINGKAIEHRADLTDYVSALQPGTKVALTVVRNKRPMPVTAVVARADNGAPDDAGSTAVPSSVSTSAIERNVLAHLGLAVHALSDYERRTTGLPGGVMIDSATGDAANAGIEAGDIVLSVNSEPVNTRDGLETAVARAGKDVALLIQRDGARSFVSLPAK
jgi:S1-C subfamily serine protease